MESSNPEGFDQFFDFARATTETVAPNVAPFGEEADVDMNFGNLCLLHPNSDCLCPNVIGSDWHEIQNSHGFEPNLFHPTADPDSLVIATDIDALNTIAAQDYSNFPQWIPRWQRPPRPCDYCRARHLDCFVTLGEHETLTAQLPGCNSCKALFRPCSLQTGTNTNAPGGFLDTLHSVSEDVVQDQGVLTGTKPLITLGATYYDVQEDRLERKSGKSLNRFSRATVGILRNWLDSHADHPYPTDEEKDELKHQTGLKRSQISNWLANARRRGKVRPKRSTSRSPNSSTQPVDIPCDDNRTPLERWKESPPENEPASIGDIKKAVSGFTPGTPEANASRSHSNSIMERQPTSSGSFSAYRAPSTTSMESIRSWKSGSQGSSWSQGSKSSYNSAAQKDRRRRRRSITTPPTRGNSVNAQQPSRPFPCTFCTDSFQSKYDWTRHEKSLHLSLEKWICAPLGPVIATGNSYNTQCVYCQELNPSQAHIDGHNHRGCEEKGLAARTFYRKDHLRQHLRLVHSVPMQNSMESWKTAPSFIRSRCGFCGQNGEAEQTFNTWQDRNDHLAKHFRSGSKMPQWRGDWGFDPEVAAMVTNAMPPFLIGKEAQTMVPFSATNEASMRSHLALNSSNDNGDIRATCWEILTLRLGQYTRQQQELGMHITDQMLQQTAREILYGSNDEWNQTAADNDEWLSLFKQAHGIVNETSRRPSIHESPTSRVLVQPQDTSQMMMYSPANSGASPHLQQHPHHPYYPGSLHNSPHLQQHHHQHQQLYATQVTTTQGLPMTQPDLFGAGFAPPMTGAEVDMLGDNVGPFFNMN